MKTKQPVSESVKKQILYLVAHGYGSRKISQIADISRSLIRKREFKRLLKNQEGVPSEFM